MNYCLVPLGCQMNQSDSERICSVLETLGYKMTDVEEEADILGVVACSVRQKAIDRVYAKIDKWNRWKNYRNLLTFVSGCILPADHEKFLSRFDLLFTINELPNLPEMIRQYGVVTPTSARNPRPEPQMESDEDKPATAGSGANRPSATAAVGELRGTRSAANSGAARTGARTAAEPGAAQHNAAQPAARFQTVALQPAVPRRKTPGGSGGPGGSASTAAASRTGSVGTLDLSSEFWKIQPTYFSEFEAYVPIQNGCDKFCTFCAVPYTRGREVSRPSDEILEEVRTLVDRGYRSITLLGQNVNSYGLDRPGRELSFAALLREIGEIGNAAARRFWVYFTSPHPRDMTEEVLRVIADYPCLAKQIHLPIQSGDDKVLIRMNRNYRVNGYRRIVERIRELLPTATLFTDIIVGFTGETEEQFENTRRAMREFRYNMAYVAIYSPRPGAASSRWEDDIPLDEKKRRLHELSAELQKTALEMNRSMIGRIVPVLVDGIDRKDGYLSAKTEGRIPVRFQSGDRSLIGNFVDVQIVSAAPLSLEGELAKNRLSPSKSGRSAVEFASAADASAP